MGMVRCGRFTEDLLGNMGRMMSTVQSRDDGDCLYDYYTGVFCFYSVFYATFTDSGQIWFWFF